MKARPGITNRNHPYKPSLRSATAMLRTADLPVPPILYEKDGWGIYGDKDCLNAGSLLGHTLTHIGCDCDFPNWALSRYLWNKGSIIPPLDGVVRFVCQECDTVLSYETYIEFCKVYNLINDIKI